MSGGMRNWREKKKRYVWNYLKLHNLYNTYAKTLNREGTARPSGTVDVS